jgi:hypothetical protein
MADASELEINIAIGSASFSASGKASTVMDALGRFAELVNSRNDSGDLLDDQGGEEGDPPAKVEPAKEGRKEPLPVFLKACKTSGNAQIATAIVAWAQKFERKDSGLKAGEVADRWRQTKLKEPGNLGRDLGNAIKAGLLHRDGGYYTVTGFGLETIGVGD